MNILPTEKLGFWKFPQYAIQGNLQLFCLMENRSWANKLHWQPTPTPFAKLSPMQGSKNNTSGGHEAVGWGVTLPTKNVVTVTSQNIQRFSSTRLNACIVEHMYFQPAYPNDLGWNVAPSLTGRSNLLRMCTDWRYIIRILYSNSIIQTERETTCAS